MTQSSDGDADLNTTDGLLALSAHELRSPVAAIVGFAETIRDRRHQLTETQLDDALDTIVRQATRLDLLLQDMLLLSAGTAGLLHLRPERVGLRAALTSVLADEGADATLVCDDGLEVWVDRGRLHQMVANYVTNARLHGRPPWTIEVAVTAEGTEVAVGDSGGGVPDAYAPSLFGRFQRAGASRAVPGSGLGLAVVRALAEASGGLAYYRPGGVGNHRFVLVLPSAPPS